MPKKTGLFIIQAILLNCFEFSQLLEAQLTLRYPYAGRDGTQLGQSVAGAGDVNGDGTPDFIIGVPYGGPYPAFGSAFVLSGSDGKTIYLVQGTGPYDILGWSVAGAGDVNGDGRADFMAGAPFASLEGLPYAGSAFVYSGRDSSLLFRVNGSDSTDYLGFSVAGVGDVNRDGKDDFMAGAPLVRPPGSTDTTGAAYVFSGADGGVLYEFFGSRPGERFGASVAGAGDVNGDGIPDFLVGAPTYNTVFVYSGLDGSLLYRLTGSGGFGTSVAGGAEVNGDGKADFIIGAPEAEDLGLAYVYSGADGSPVYQFGPGVGRGKLGYSVAIPGDMNRDGTDDFLAGAPVFYYEGGAAFIFSGATGTRLCEVNDGGISVLGYGFAVAGIGDIDRDGRPDIIVGAPYARFGREGTGWAAVYTADTIPPVISCPLEVKKNICPGEEGGNVSFNAGAVDFCPVPGAVCSPPSGSFFPLGITAVTCVGSDVSGNKDTCHFNVNVVIDQIPPSMQCPTDTFPGPEITGCTSSSDSAAIVEFSVRALDNCPDSVAIVCSPPSGFSFPVGVTPVSCSATDNSGNTDSCKFSVEILRKGDMNRDQAFTVADVTLMLNCVFLSLGNCSLCFSDVNCSGDLTPPDVVVELLAVFTGVPIACP